MFPSSKIARGTRRRLTLGITAAILFATLAVAAMAGHWPLFGGDAGRSGHQPIEPTGAPITKAYAKAEDDAIVTSVITSAGGDATVRRMAYGTEGSGGGSDGNVHLQRLSDGARIGPEAGVDVEDGPNDIDTFRGRATDAGASGRNPSPAGSVTPADTSTAASLGQVLALHNDDNQDGGAVNPFSGATDPRTGNDIALAIIDEATGAKSVDKEVGSANVNNTSDANFDPTQPNTVNYRTSSSPLLTAPAADGSRELYFMAEREAAFAEDDPTTGFPCAPATSFEDPPPAGPATRGCDVNPQMTLFKLRISDALTTNANFTPADLSWVHVASANPLASPTLVNLDGAAHIAVATTTGAFHLYKAADIDPADPATPAPAFSVTGLGVQVQTPSVPVTSTGALPNPAPAMFVAANAPRSGTAIPTSRVHRIERDPEDPTKLKIAQSSPPLAGEAAPALAVSSQASPTGGTFTGGRVLYTTARNLYSLQPDDLTRGAFLDIGNSLAAGTTGFSRTTAAVSGGIAFVQRDNGEHLARDQRTLDPVEFTPYGPTDVPPENDPAANDGIGQPSIASRLVQFGNADGAFVYRASPFVPAPGSVQIAVSDVAVKEGDSGTSVATFTLTKTGIGGGAVTVQSADGTAKAGEDYVAAGPTVVTFEDAETTKTFDVTINGDTTFESDEFFKLQLTNPTTGVVITDSEGSGIIQNDEPVPSGGTDAVLIVSDAVVTEGDFKDVLATFTVSLTSPSKNAVTVRYGTGDRTAIGGKDYTPTFGTFTFAPGEQTKTFTVAVRRDTRREATETFLVGIANATGAEIADPVGVGTIIDDDGAPARRFAKAPSISLKVTPKRDRTKPFRFTSTGVLRIPSGVPRGKGCRGRVSVQVKAVRKTISTRRARVKSNCRYRTSVTFKSAKRFSSSGVLSFRARYLGTPFLKKAKSKEIKVRTTR